MSRILWIVGILMVTLALAPAAGLAAEHGGKEHGGASTAAPAATTQSQASATSAAPTQEATSATTTTTTATTITTPAATVPALKPIVITFSGDLAAVDSKAAPAMVTVQDRYGVRKEIAVPDEAKISQGASAKALADLKVGDKLTVEYTYDVATGKRTAQAISMGEATSKAASQ